jgi:hypothetical protein
MMRTAPIARPGRLPRRIAALAALVAGLASTGCAFTVVRPAPLYIGSAERGNQRTVHYPAYVLVHDSESVWDAHQIKDNIVGLSEGEVVHWADLGADALTPGPPRTPIQHFILWSSDRYAELPDCAPVRIVGGFFSALGLDKTTLLSGATRIAAAPGDPVSYFVVTRAVYLVDWSRTTVGELNTGAGRLAPWPGTFVPQAISAPINHGVEWTEFGVVTLYIRLFRGINNAVDNVITGCENAYGGVVYAVLWSTGTLELATDDAKAKETDVGIAPGPGSKSK